MLGKEMDDLSDIKSEAVSYETKDGDTPVFEAEQLQSDAGIKPFDFYIKKGEVNGFTGLLGSGRSECVRAIFGADRVIQGKVKKNGQEVKISKTDMKGTEIEGAQIQIKCGEEVVDSESMPNIPPATS